MGYGDECTRSRDIDNLESKVRDLEFEIDRKEHDLQRQIEYLAQRVDEPLSRVVFLENGNSQ